MRGRKRKAIKAITLSSSLRAFSIHIPEGENRIEMSLKFWNGEDVLKVNKQLTEVLQSLISQ